MFRLKQKELFEPDDNSAEFDPAQAKALHTRLLEESLHTLGDDRNGDDIRKDVMEWASSDSGDVFAFRTCCACAGIDPVKLRERLEYLIKKWEANDGIQDQA